ncbi:MAG TPA: FHA domain-containing protein, partial [Polyangiaceae bacterium]|nr:FHA domain-containing protein [Polyangiaceae bacterium]
MIPGFGKQTITIGTAPTCDLVLNGEGVAPEHARIVLQAGGSGKLVLTPLAPNVSANGQPVPPGAEAPFDLRTQFFIGQVAIPLNHPAITLMLMANGSITPPPGQIIIGRDGTRASIVINHPSVSSQHATVALDRMMVIDHASTSGTYVGTQRIQPNAPTPIDPNGILAFGPVPVQVGLLMRLAQALRSNPAAAQAVPAGPAMQLPTVAQPVAQQPHISGA